MDDELRKFVRRRFPYNGIYAVEGNEFDRVLPILNNLEQETKADQAIDRQAITELKRFDGKFVVLGNDDS